MKTHKIKPETWRNTWLSTFRKLPQEDHLRESLLLAIVESTPQDSRNRELTCQRLQRLSEYAGLSIDLMQYIGDYEPEPRDIPPDDLILEYRDKIPNPFYKWAYGVMACFGLRPHEVFTCSFVSGTKLKVDKSAKTGERVARAIRPEWAQAWRLDLEKVASPTESSSHRERGQLLSHAHDRYGIPFVPYDLRHAYAIRVSVVYKVPLPTAAQWMGHSIETHGRVYQRWLKESTNDAVYDSIVLGKSTPPTA